MMQKYKNIIIGYRRRITSMFSLFSSKFFLIFACSFGTKKESSFLASNCFYRINKSEQGEEW